MDTMTLEAPVAVAAPVQLTKTGKPKKIKANPSETYIGLEISSEKPCVVNYRKGKSNVVECDRVVCTAANPAGRRLSLKFYMGDNLVFERKVYKEYFEKIADMFDVELP